MSLAHAASQIHPCLAQHAYEALFLICSGCPPWPVTCFLQNGLMPAVWLLYCAGGLQQLQPDKVPQPAAQHGTLYKFTRANLPRQKSNPCVCRWPASTCSLMRPQPADRSGPTHARRACSARCHSRGGSAGISARQGLPASIDTHLQRLTGNPFALFLLLAAVGCDSVRAGRSSCLRLHFSAATRG